MSGNFRTLRWKYYTMQVQIDQYLYFKCLKYALAPGISNGQNTLIWCLKADFFFLIVNYPFFFFFFFFTTFLSSSLIQYSVWSLAVAYIQACCGDPRTCGRRVSETALGGASIGSREQSRLISIDWFKGTFTGWEHRWFPVKIFQPIHWLFTRILMCYYTPLEFCCKPAFHPTLGPFPGKGRAASGGIHGISAEQGVCVKICPRLPPEMMDVEGKICRIPRGFESKTMASCKLCALKILEAIRQFIDLGRIFTSK